MDKTSNEWKEFHEGRWVSVGERRRKKRIGGRLLVVASWWCFFVLFVVLFLIFSVVLVVCYVFFVFLEGVLCFFFLFHGSWFEVMTVRKELGGGWMGC